MNETNLETAPHVDRRADYYHSRARDFGSQYPGYHWPSAHLIMDLTYTYDLVNEQFARMIMPYGLSPTAFNLMMILKRSETGKMPLHELSELLLVSRPNITGLVDSLEKRELVQRLPGPGDRRVKMASLTEAGHAFLHSMLPDHFIQVRQLANGLTEPELEQLDHLLERVRHSLDQFKQLEPSGSK